MSTEYSWWMNEPLDPQLTARLRSAAYEPLDRLRAELRAAYEATGWSMTELLDRSGLTISVSTLRRKLIGDGRKGRRLTSLKSEEILALVRAMTLTLLLHADGAV